MARERGLVLLVGLVACTSSSTPSDAGHASTPDASADTSCHPHPSPHGFAPTAKPLPEPYPACDGGSLFNLLAACFNQPDAATDAGCDASLAGACGKCAVTPETASAWGPILTFPAPGGSPPILLTVGNLGGCMNIGAHSDKARACGDALQRVQQCELAACTPYCPVVSAEDYPGQFALLGTAETPGCVQGAAVGPCVDLWTQATAACAPFQNEAGTGLYNQCTGLVEQADLTELVGLFCGGATVTVGDGGSRD